MMFGDVPPGLLVICPSCGAMNEKFNWMSWGAGIGAAGACYLCGFEVLPEDTVEYGNHEELVVVPWTLARHQVQQEAVNKLRSTVSKMAVVIEGLRNPKPKGGRSP